MTFNWGTGIALVYGLFAFSMIFMVTRSRKVESDLVQKDYYQLDLDYQQHLEKKQKAAALETATKATYLPATKTIDLVFGAAQPTGKIKAYRYNAQYDTFFQEIKVEPGENTHLVKIPAEKLASGRWHLELDWKADGRAYFEEMDIWVQ